MRRGKNGIRLYSLLAWRQGVIRGGHTVENCVIFRRRRHDDDDDDDYEEDEEKILHEMSEDESKESAKMRYLLHAPKFNDHRHSAHTTTP